MVTWIELFAFITLIIEIITLIIVIFRHENKKK